MFVVAGVLMCSFSGGVVGLIVVVKVVLVLESVEVVVLVVVYIGPCFYTVALKIVLFD